jgi:septal ring factor EnvC (AmiA/AmiB activator)
MKICKKYFFLFLLLFTLLSLSCAAPPGRVDVVLPPDRDDQQSDAVAKRFQEPSSQGRTAVESAIELSEKYARLSEQAAELRENNKYLINENTKLKDQVVALEADLKQTKKELTEANDLLIEMLTELNNWKTNILGFRNEMRKAEKAQLEALLKVLEILGGEVEAKSVRQQDESATEASLDQSVPTEVPTNQNLDEPNE